MNDISEGGGQWTANIYVGGEMCCIARGITIRLPPRTTKEKPIACHYILIPPVIFLFNDNIRIIHFDGFSFAGLLGSGMCSQGRQERHSLTSIMCCTFSAREE